MEETIDFKGASVDDFKIAGVSEPATAEIAEQPTQDGNQQTVQENVQPNVQESVQESKQVVENQEVAKSESARDYQFKDDFIKGVVEFYEKTGDLTPYLQAKSLDFNSMSDEDIVRRSLREQYSDLSDKAFDRLYKQQVVDKYKLNADEYGEEDSELGKELLKAEASRLRTQYTEWQNNFKAPEPVEDDSDMRRAEQFAKEVQENEFTKRILGDKRISIKIGEGEFNYELPDANSLLEMTVDNDRFFEQFALGQGQLDYARWYKTAAYSQNPELFEKALVNYGKALGREEVTKEIKNPSTAPVSDVPTESSGDFTTGLLQAFANRGIKK